MPGSIPLKFRNHPLEKAAAKGLRKLGKTWPKNKLAMLQLLMLTQGRWQGPNPDEDDELLDFLLLLDAKTPQEVFSVLQLTTRPPWEIPMSAKELENAAPLDLANAIAEVAHSGLVSQDAAYRDAGQML